MTEKAEHLNNQAIRLAADGAYTEAIACFARAITIDKDNSLLWYNLGLTYRDAGKLNDAKDALTKALQIAPDDADVIEELALILFSLKDFDTAIQICLAGLQMYPENSHLWNTRGVCFFNKGDFEEASEAFETAVFLNPYYYDALYNLRDTYTELGNQTGAAECAKKLSEIKKNGENR